MTGAIILYDHVNPTGAFDKKSQIDVKAGIIILWFLEELVFVTIYLGLNYQKYGWISSWFK